LHSSNTTKNKSNLDKIGGLISILYYNGLDLSYRPNSGFAAAKILVLEFNVAYIPAFAIDIVYYSIASCIAD